MFIYEVASGRVSHQLMACFSNFKDIISLKWYVLTVFLCSYEKKTFGWLYNLPMKFTSKTFQDHKTLPRVNFIGCRGVKLFKLKHRFRFCQNLNCQNLSCWVLSQFEFSGFITILFFEFCCYFSFWVLLLFLFSPF